MARRYFLTDMETGSNPDLGDYRQPKLMAQAWPDQTSVTYLAHKTEPWALVVVCHAIAVPPVSPALADALPDFPHDAKVSAMHAATKAAMVSAMTKRGIPSDIVTSADGYRDVIRGIGRRIDPAFHEDTFGLSGF
jgi:hypothetical protein